MEREPLTFTLRHPALLLRPADRGFSAPVAVELQRAVEMVQAADSNPLLFELAYAALKPLLPRRMSRGQRLLAYHLLAQCAGQWDLAEAVTYSSRALELATDAHDQGAIADILHLRGIQFRRSTELRAAVYDYAQLLGLLREHETGPGSAAKRLELDTLIGLAHFRTWLEEFAAAERHIEEAYALNRQAPSTELTVVTILWIEALIERFRNRPYPALKYAIAAAEVYEASPRHVLSTVRVMALAAELALDMAALFPSEVRASSTFAQMAEEYTAYGERLARRHDDESGRGLIALARARAARIRRRNERTRALIETVIALATRQRDWALRSQAWTALGFDLCERDNRSGAEAAFQAALDDLDFAHAPALGILPRRALLDLREGRDP